jgi:hypothetical protein
MILALDNATRTGFCFGPVGGAPIFGSHHFGRNRSNGEVLADFEDWLNAKIDAVGAQIVCFESPYMPTGARNPWASPANALTVRRLFGFAGMTEAVCRKRGLRCYEAAPSEITRALLGDGAPRKREAKKAATVAMCQRLGFPVADDDEGDATALWLYAESVHAPRMLSQRRGAVGLELALA